MCVVRERESWLFESQGVQLGNSGYNILVLLIADKLWSMKMKQGLESSYSTK